MLSIDAHTNTNNICRIDCFPMTLTLSMCARVCMGQCVRVYRLVVLRNTFTAVTLSTGYDYFRKLCDSH